MRKPDVIVEEVVCSETGKPMAKIPLWMAGMKVRFVSDEARQKHPTPIGIPDIDPIRKAVDSEGSDELKDLDAVSAIDPDGFDDPDADAEEAGEEDVDG